MATLVLFFSKCCGVSRDQDGGSVRLDKMAAQCVVTEKALVRPFTLDTFDSIRQQDGDEKRVSFRRLWLFLQFKNHFFQKDCSRDEMVVWIN